MTSPSDTRTDRAAAPHAPQGARIDRSQETYRPSPYEARVTPPSGDVAPDGSRPWPQPSLASRILVWGGVAAGAAAATAGTVLAVRAVVDGITGGDDKNRAVPAPQRARDAARPAAPSVPRNAFAGDDAPSRRPAPQPKPRPRGETGLAPRFADLPEDERAAMRARVEARQQAERADRARARRKARPAAAASQGGALGLIGGLSRSITDVTSGLRDAVGTVAAAVEGFRSVAGQAGSIMEEFRGAADSVRTMFEGAGDRPAARPRQPDAGNSDARRRTAEGEQVDLRDDPAAGGEAARTHRL